MEKSFNLGLDTFGDVTQGPDGRFLGHPQVLRNVVKEAVLADSLGLDFFGVGEHHREDFAVSAPEVVLASIARETSNIRLGSAVTVLNSDDPIRVHQRFSTLDALSDGRAEVILGRGSFSESFPLFGIPREEYAQQFEEKLEIFVEARKEGEIRWEGSTRPPLRGERSYPPGHCASSSERWLVASQQTRALHRRSLLHSPCFLYTSPSIKLGISGVAR